MCETILVRASRSSRSVKSSRYNRKRASGARHTQCVRHTGCSSEAASGNVVEFHIGEFHKVTSSIEIVRTLLRGGGGGGGGVQKSFSMKLPLRLLNDPNFSRAQSVSDPRTPLRTDKLEFFYFQGER